MLARLMRVPLLAVVAVLLSLAPRATSAQAEVSRLMHEPIAYTDVLDALDGRDRIDLSVQLAYERSRDRGTLYREHTTPSGERRLSRVAQAERELSRLALGFEVGIFRDVMAFVRLPLILGDARSLSPAAGVDDLTSAALLGDATTGAPLFALPFAAPTRAGLDYLALGGAWALLNQMRVPWHSTWMLRIEGRRALAAPLRACRLRDEVTSCGSGTAASRGGSSGASEGLSALLLETRFSRRYRHAEPFAGLGAQVSWPTRATRSYRGGRPGPEASATLGVALIPWEDRGSFQRVALDMRLDGTYVARGLAYGALFDALGTSMAPALVRVPEVGCAEGDCEASETVAFRGVTEVASRLRYGGRLGLEVQAARYVRFAVGASLHAVTAHALSGRDACMGGGQLAATSDPTGSVCVRGRADPGHRDEIDAPGRRFFMRDELLLGGYAQATAMF